MESIFNIMLIPFLIAMFLALNMGGSGTGPAFSVAFGANIIRKSAIPGLFGIMVFIGALVAGQQTSTTLGREILNPDLMSLNLVSIILLSVGISLLIANIFGIPQSTSQSTVLAVSAPALYFSQLNAHKLWFEIVPTWFVLPVISFFISFAVGKYIYKPLRKRGYTISKRLNESKTLNAFILIMSLYVAFSIGTNNVANAVGPITSMTVNEYGLSGDPHTYRLIMLMSMLIIAPCFGIGSSIFGYRVVQKTGKEIVRFGKIEAVVIAFISASLLLLASVWKGIPTSLVQLNVAAILGIGVAKLGFKNIFRKTQVNQFFAMWIIAPAIAFGLCLFLVWLADSNQLL
jgi:sulfate permease